MRIRTIHDFWFEDAPRVDGRAPLDPRSFRPDRPPQAPAEPAPEPLPRRVPAPAPELPVFDPWAANFYK